MNFRKSVENFAPSWYAVVMGTSGLGVALGYSSDVVGWFFQLGFMFFVLSVFLFLIFLFPWILRFFIATDKIRDELKHPVQSCFFPTMPISLLLISVGVVFFGEGRSLAESVSLVLFIIGAVIVLVFGVHIISNFFLSKTELSSANFAWFIPPVSHIVVSRAGLEVFGSGEQYFVLWISVLFLGVGLFLYLFFGGVVVLRYVMHGVPTGNLFPTTFIHLAPLGIFSSNFAKLGSIYDASWGELISLLFWSFGVWWFLISVILFLKHIGELRFALSWWSFVFPLCAISLGTYSVYSFSSDKISGIIAVFLVSLDVIALLVWAYVSSLTVVKLVRREPL